MQAYFDNSATTKPLPEAVEAVSRAMTETWGNPSSLHVIGDTANGELENARRTLASAFGCRQQEVYFTGSGTESNNIAVFGTVEALKRRGNRIVTTAVEHPSVEGCMKRLENEGFDVVRLPVDKTGQISEEAIYEAVNDKTILVSLMLVNNEVGSIMPVKAAAKALKRAGAPGHVHVDAVQGFGKVPVGPKALGADLISVSGHKVHGPKGVGALYVKKGTRLVSPVLGGGQEDNIRPGTQGTPAIAGFAAAVDTGILHGDLSSYIAHVHQLGRRRAPLHPEPVPRGHPLRSPSELPLGTGRLRVHRLGLLEGPPEHGPDTDGTRAPAHRLRRPVQFFPYQHHRRSAVRRRGPDPRRKHTQKRLT